MIFLTVGTQLAFDRLVGAVDDWCGKHPSISVFAQVGPTKLKIEHMESRDFLSPEETKKMVLASKLIIAHAGMGSVLTALKYRKPILIVPRKASLGEHRNEHQLATANWLEGHLGIHVAWDETEIAALLDGYSDFQEGGELSEYASPELIENLKKFIFS